MIALLAEVLDPTTALVNSTAAVSVKDIVIFGSIVSLFLSFIAFIWRGPKKVNEIVVTSLESKEAQEKLQKIVIDNLKTEAQAAMLAAIRVFIASDENRKYLVESHYEIHRIDGSREMHLGHVISALETKTGREAILGVLTQSTDAQAFIDHRAEQKLASTQELWKANFEGIQREQKSLEKKIDGLIERIDRVLDGRQPGVGRQ